MKQKITRLNIARGLHGFSLIELAIVLVILGLLLTGLLPTLASQLEQRQLNETRKQLDDIQQALLGFAVANNRLPCPASDSSNGQESFCSSNNGSCSATTSYQTHGRCSHPYNGFVPAASLGISPIDDQGYVLDAWQKRIRYAVTDIRSNAFTKTAGIASTTMTTISTDELLFICDSATGNNNNCGSAIKLTDKTPALIFSQGKKEHGSNDEAANLDNNKIFISHTPNQQFDDLFAWISPHILFNRMVAAGQLP